jgi:glycosyltransferase involved in cell wall biosynthesis
VTNIPTPYRVPLLNILDGLLAGIGCQLRVFFCARTYRRRTWSDPLAEARFDYEVLRSLVIQRGERAVMMPVNLARRLGRFRPDVTIVGGLSVPALIVSALSRLRGTPYIIWSGEVASRAVSHGAAKRWLQGALACNADAFIAYGTRAAEYVSSLAPLVPVFNAWNTVDVDFFSQGAEAARHEDRGRGHDSQDPSDAVSVLTVGYLTAGKGIDLLLRALPLVRSTRGRSVTLEIVGDGPERQHLEGVAAELGLGDQVHFWGDQPKTELPRFYGRADIFAFPTLYDIWGLVLVEAMASGLPVVASHRAGATVDLIEEGVTGLVVEPTDVGELAAAITSLVDDDGLRASLGGKAKCFAHERLTLERSAEGFIEAMRAVS